MVVRWAYVVAVMKADRKVYEMASQWVVVMEMSRAVRKDATESLKVAR